MPDTATTGSAAGAAGEQVLTKPPLDDVMLAMDVVDTLRRRQRLVERELDVAGREEDLKERLRKIYAAQGIEVSDAILEQGVTALKEDRFTYKPPPKSFGVTLARIYVSRGVWGKWVLGAVALIAAALLAWQLLVVAPRNALPADLEAAHAEVVQLATQDSADQQADALLAEAKRALGEGDAERARGLLGELQRMREQLAASYQVRVVNRPGERSGVFRIPDVNQAARNYYLIVEAVGPGGAVLRVPVKNEETGRVEDVTQWGLRVDQRTYDRVAADKKDDGIIQQDLIGRKRAGRLTADYDVSTSGAAITDW